MNTQFETSITVRPQPRQMSSNKVEQMATHGESSRANGLGVSELSLPDMGETVSVVIARNSSVVACLFKT